jgi:5'-nucleotidase
VIFLITNDDGYEARGLQEFAAAMREIGDVYVVAPDSVRSCCSHSVTTAEELHLQQMAPQDWSVSGTPTDCVRVAVRWLGIRPDWVLSGVNEGGNLGVDIHYSGTVAGAREATLLGYRSMAISQYLRRDRERDWKLSGQRARFAFESLSQRTLDPATFWNINLPVVDHKEIALELAHCDPEPDMLHFEYEHIERFTQPDQGLALEKIIYRSNYQMRPRSDHRDVAMCFAGAITCTRLDVRLV